METTELIWMNGEFVPWGNARVHVLTHTMHYGSGVFEGIRCYEAERGAAIFRLREHVQRLIHSAHVMNIPLSYHEEQLFHAIVETVQRNALKAGYIRPLIFYDYGKMGLYPKGAPVSVLVACWPWGSYLGEKPVRVKISSFRRVHPRTSNMNAKITGNYANSILASEDIHKQGYDEALLLDCEGYAAEGPGENIFMVKGDVIFTPPPGTILPGITRDSIITIARNEGYLVREIPLLPKDLFEADEAFFTGTAAEVTSIASIDERKMREAPGRVTQKLKTIYLDAVHGRNEKYKSWLTYVE